VLDVRNFATESLEPLPALLRGDRADAIASLGALDRELLLVLERAHLLPDGFWQQLERASPP
jgi:hypothetical protein